jgi:hypothetical protein
MAHIGSYRHIGNKRQFPPVDKDSDTQVTILF